MNSKYQLMPAMTPSQYSELKEDIRLHGVLIPIEYDQEGNILDGHHRYQAFEELIVEGADLPLYDKIVRKFASEEEKVAYVVALNVKRRHLTSEQRQELVVRLRKEFGYTLSKIAQVLGISIATASRDIDALPQAERDELKSLSIQGSDGRSYSPKAWEVPRIFHTGTQQLRKMQNDVINEAAAGLAEKYMAEAEAEIAAKKLAASLVQEPAAASPLTAKPPIEAVIGDEEARERLTAFAWYGGKASHLGWLLPLLPRTRHFVDLFGGSAAVLLNRAPSTIETYNDLDNNVVNFFRVLRNSADDLIWALNLTPYSREERKEALRSMREPPPNTAPDVEKARQFFIMAKQTPRGQAQMITDSELNAWRFTRATIQRGIGVYNAQWQSGIDGLSAVAARLRNVQIENYPALDVIRLYNDPGVLLYCDPPYVHDTRRLDKTSTYAHEMTPEDHVALSVALHNHKGPVALSGYPSPLYDELYADWHYIDVPYESSSSQSIVSMTIGSRIERLWTNYDLGIKR